MERKVLFLGLVALALAVVFAVQERVVTMAAPQPAASSSSATTAGSPLIGLTPTELTLFNAGRTDFLEVEDEADGLGPVFNGTSCAGCHSIPAVGGGSFVTEVRAGKSSGGSFDPLGGSLFQLFSIPDHECQIEIPEGANVIGRRISLPILGDGLVEAIPDQDIKDYAAEPKPYGIQGHAANVYDVAQKSYRVGRFGWKAQQATLLAFSGDAYNNEMGITNALFPNELAAGVPCDTVPDPEDKVGANGLTGIQNFANFMKFLAPPDRAANANDPAVKQGEKVFAQIGCNVCHKPSYTTGASTTAPLNHKTVPLYSDLLLHNVGTGDGIPQADANAYEFRTPALWGLRYRRPLLHDGSVLSILEAIQRHGGEATTVISNFRGLSAQDRDALIAFLKSL